MTAHPGTLIRNRLAELGRKHGPFAREVGISRNYLYRVMRGDDLLSFDAVKRCADVLELDPVELLVARMAQSDMLRVPVPQDDEGRRALAVLVLTRECDLCHAQPPYHHKMDCVRSGPVSGGVG